MTLMELQKILGDRIDVTLKKDMTPEQFAIYKRGQNNFTLEKTEKLSAIITRGVLIS